jgi:hypothetical protein
LVFVRGTSASRRGGFTLLGVGPSLLLALLVSFGTGWEVGRGGTGTDVYPDRFPLFPTQGNSGASGMAYLKQPWSPFGVSVDEDGYVQYELVVEVGGLPAVDGEVYRVWITTPELDPIEHLGTLKEAGSVTGSTDWHQLMVVVSREPSDRVVAEGDRWDGPIVLRGFSAGARVTPMAQHSLFQQSPM